MNMFRKRIFRLPAGRGVGDWVLLMAALLIIPASIISTVHSASGEQPAVQTKSSLPPTCAMSVTYSEGLFSVTATQCHLRALLSEIGLKGGIKFEADVSLQESLITVSFVGKKLDDAIGAILDMAGQKNIAVEYEKAGGRDSELRVTRVFLARRETENSGLKTLSDIEGKQSKENIIYFSNPRLTVMVEDIDVMELLKAIEIRINVPGERDYRIIVNDPIISKISINMENSHVQDVLDNIVRRLIPKVYAGQYYTHYLIPEGTRKKDILAYIIRKMSEEEVASRDRKIGEYLEKGKSLSEEGAYLEAQKFFGGIYQIDRFNADGEFYSGLNALRQSAPAVESFKLVLENDPEYVDAYYWLGIAYEKEEIYDEAIKAYGEYLARGKDENLKKEAKRKLAELESPEVKQYFLDLRRAETYKSKKEIQTAVGMYKDLISRHQSRPEAYMYLMRLYWFQGNMDAVYEMVQKIADGQEKNKILFALGNGFRGQKELAKARRLFEELLQKNPGKELRNQVDKAMKEMN